MFGKTNVTQGTYHTLSTCITAYRCHVFFTISNVYIQAVLSVKLTFFPHQHVLKLNKHGNVNKCPPINIYFLLAVWKISIFLENQNVRELMSSRVKRVVSS